MLKLSAGEAKGLVTEYQLPGSRRFGEEARLENLNQLMSHFGVSSESVLDVLQVSGYSYYAHACRLDTVSMRALPQS